MGGGLRPLPVLVCRLNLYFFYSICFPPFPFPGSNTEEQARAASRRAARLQGATAAAAQSGVRACMQAARQQPAALLGPATGAGWPGSSMQALADACKKPPPAAAAADEKGNIPAPGWPQELAEACMRHDRSERPDFSEILSRVGALLVEAQREAAAAGAA